MIAITSVHHQLRPGNNLQPSKQGHPPVPQRAAPPPPPVHPSAKNESFTVPVVAGGLITGGLVSGLINRQFRHRVLLRYNKKQAIHLYQNSEIGQKLEMALSPRPEGTPPETILFGNGSRKFGPLAKTSAANYTASYNCIRIRPNSPGEMAGSVAHEKAHQLVTYAFEANTPVRSESEKLTQRYARRYAQRYALPASWVNVLNRVDPSIPSEETWNSTMQDALSWRIQPVAYSKRLRRHGGIKAPIIEEALAQFGGYSVIHPPDKAREEAAAWISRYYPYYRKRGSAFWGNAQWYKYAHPVLEQVFGSDATNWATDLTSVLEKQALFNQKALLHSLDWLARHQR
jgi:hypothetical protein